MILDEADAMTQDAQNALRRGTVKYSMFSYRQLILLSEHYYMDFLLKDEEESLVCVKTCQCNNMYHKLN